MGQSTSSLVSTAYYRFKLISSAVITSFELTEEAKFSEDFAVGRDYTADLPCDVLVHIFNFLGTADRKRCSLVCRLWLYVCRSCRGRSIEGVEFDRSGADVAFGIWFLTRVDCKDLTTLSFDSCTISAEAMNAVLDQCTSLEKLSLKRLRGELDSAEPIGPGAAASSLKSICLKELVHGQNFQPLIVGSRKLKTLKLIRCLGEWDEVLHMLGKFNPRLTKIHLERVQVSDVGLCGISNCSNLEILYILRTTECSNSGLVCVAEHCKLLRKLHIDDGRTYRIGDEGLIAVAEQCPKLQELVLIGMNPTLTSLELIASNCQKLERLALCKGGTVGDAEIFCIIAKCAALKKLCVWDERIEALDFDSSNLVMVMVKKCEGVSTEVADWLQERKGFLIVILDACEIEPLDGSGSELGVQESGMEFPPIVSQGTMAADVASSSNSRSSKKRKKRNSRSSKKSSNSRITIFRTKFGSFTGQKLVACTLRRWSNGEDDGSNSNL